MLRFLNSAMVAMLLLLAPVTSSAQNFVDMKETAIIRIMADEYQEFRREADFVNDYYRYLKYVTSDGLQTMLVFLDKRDICSEVRLTIDRSLHDKVVNNLDTTYQRNGEGKWIDTRRGKTYGISLTDETWYYTVRFKAIVKNDSIGSD